jgi:hypothetical protein
MLHSFVNVNVRVRVHVHVCQSVKKESDPLDQCLPLSLGSSCRQGYPGFAGIETVPWNLIRLTPA